MISGRPFTLRLFLFVEKKGPPNSNTDFAVMGLTNISLITQPRLCRRMRMSITRISINLVTITILFTSVLSPLLAIIQEIKTYSTVRLTVRRWPNFFHFVIPSHLTGWRAQVHTRHHED